MTGRTTALLPVHIFGYPADMPAFEALGLPIVEDACEALGAVHATARPSAGAGTPPCSASTPTSSSRPVRAGCSRELRRGEGAGRQRAQPGPRARHGLARPRPPGVQLPPHATSPARSASPSSSASTGCSPAARGSPAATARRSPASTASGCRARTPAAIGAAGSCSSSSCRAARRDDDVLGLRERGIQSKPYLPAIHLMSFYRERFGHREGEFPVCEDVAARSLALPFFPEMTEGQVERVARRWPRCSVGTNERVLQQTAVAASPSWALSNRPIDICRYDT